MPSAPDAPSRSQSANLSGEGNANVQIQGDNNVVHIGRSRLDLTLYRGRRRGAVSSPTVEAGEAAEILSPYAMAVPLVGRERELADLWTWMNGDPDLSIRVLTAPGGGGKTRLALELCEEAVHLGWHAGFVKTPASLDSVDAGLSRPTLAVVDYAAAWLPWLRVWLDNLASAPPAGGKLRILLLERYADPKGGWWAEAFQSGGWGDHAVQARLDPADGPYVLAPLAPVEDRRNILEEVFKQVGSDLRLPRSLDLAEMDWGGEPLFLLLAGLIAAREGFAHVLTLNRTDLAFDVAKRHELNRIGRIGESRLQHSRALVCHMAAYVTLCQGLTRDQLEEAVAAEKQALRFDSVGDPPQIYKILHAALPRVGADVAPILPDVVGEAAILLALGDGNPGKARDSVARAAAMASERVTVVVIRMAQDFGSVDGKPLQWLDCLAERAGDTQTLQRLVASLPEQTLALREIAARLTAAVVERLRGAGDMEELAAFVNALSCRLSDLGHREEALEAVQESVDVYRELSQSRPDAFSPELAASLNNLSLRLSDLGRRKEALKVAQEVVVIRRELSQIYPDTFRLLLAKSLSNLALRLKDVGSREEALEAVQEAVIIYRELLQSRLDARPDVLNLLAASLNNLSNCLSDVGCCEEALEVLQEAVEVYRELLQSRPDAFRPELATSLNNLSHRLSDVGCREEALEAVREGLDVYRELSQARPDVYRPDLATSLNNLASCLSRLGRHEEALAAGQEAVTIRRELSHFFSDAFRPTLASAIYNCSVCLQELGRLGEALEASEEAVHILLPFFQAFPAAFRDFMAKMTRLYLTLSEENGLQPKLELIEAIVSTLQKIQPPESPEPSQPSPNPGSPS